MGKSYNCFSGEITDPLATDLTSVYTCVGRGLSRQLGVSIWVHLKFSNL